MEETKEGAEGGGDEDEDGGDVGDAPFDASEWFSEPRYQDAPPGHYPIDTPLFQLKLNLV